MAEEQNWLKEAAATTQKYSFLKDMPPECLYGHHGLRWLPQAVKDYIANGDILDIGAAVGDSLAVLDQYTSKRVVSYDLIPENAKEASKVAEHFSPEKHIIVTTGLSNFVGFHRVLNKFSIIAGLHETGDVLVPISTVDIEVRRLNLSVGLIKVDVEGTEAQVLEGAMETIQRFRPVISIGIYHNIEFYDLPKKLSEMGYRLRFALGQFSWGMHWEITCIAVPDFLPQIPDREKHLAGFSARWPCSDEKRFGANVDAIACFSTPETEYPG
jgi:FkbM family methyltransferase